MIVEARVNGRYAMARSLAKDHEDKRSRILTIAAQQFAAQGYAQASMAQVSEACGISKANIYHYYPSKTALLFDILNSYLSELRERVCGLAEQGLTPAERLHALTAEILLAYEGMDALHKIQTESLHLLPQDQQETLRGYQRDMVRKLSGILAQAGPETLGQNADELHSATMSVFGMLNWFYMWNRGADRAARVKYAKLVADLTLAGVSGLQTPPKQPH